MRRVGVPFDGLNTRVGMRCARGFEAVVRRVVGVDGRLRRGVNTCLVSCANRYEVVFVCERVLFLYGFMVCFHTRQISVSL